MCHSQNLTFFSVRNIYGILQVAVPYVVIMYIKQQKMGKSIE